MDNLSDKLITLLVKTMVYISPYCPLYIIILITTGINIYKRWCTYNIFTIGLIITMILFIINSFISIVLLKSSIIHTRIEIELIKEINPIKAYYVILYIIPFILLGNVMSIKIYILCIWAYIITGYHYITENDIQMNPMWTILGYKTYITNNNIIILSNINKSELVDTTLKGAYLKNNLIIIHKHNNQTKTS